MCKPTAQDAQPLREKQTLKKIYKELGLTNKNVQYLVKNGLHDPEELYKYCRKGSGFTKLRHLRTKFEYNDWMLVTEFMQKYYQMVGTYEGLETDFWEPFASYLVYKLG